MAITLKIVSNGKRLLEMATATENPAETILNLSTPILYSALAPNLDYLVTVSIKPVEATNPIDRELEGA